MPSMRFRTLVAVGALLFVLVLLVSRTGRSSLENLAGSSSTTQIWASTIAATGSLLVRPGKDISFSSRRSLMNATFVSLVRNSELEGMLSSIRQVEERFNHNYHYDWVFLNDDDFTEQFIDAATEATSGRARFGKIEKEQWGYPGGIDLQVAAEARENMGKQENGGIPYGSSESYRHMCRYQSGFFYRHPLVLDYDWYWRVEPNIELFCDLPYDPFRYMAEHGQKYSFVISMNEISRTVPSLWTHVRGFMADFPQHLSNDSHLAFLSEDGGVTTNYCHFWDNFEIADLRWFRSEAYNDFFNYLDAAGGFFYERWGDASVHSIAASLLLDKGQIHFFDDIGYWHAPVMSCPRSAAKRKQLNCRCGAENNMDWAPSCTKRFFEAARIEFPEGFDRNVPPEPGLLR